MDYSPLLRRTTVRVMHILRRLLIAFLIFPGLLRAELIYPTVTDLDTPAVQVLGSVHYGLDSGLVGDGRGSFYGVGSRYGANGKGFVFRTTTDG